MLKELIPLVEDRLAMTRLDQDTKEKPVSHSFCYFRVLLSM